MRGELPEGWVEVELSDVGKLHCGQSPPTAEVNHTGEGEIYVTGPDQWDGTSLRLDKWTTQPKRVAPDGCVFITVKGAGVGTVFPGTACAIGRDVYAFEPAEGVVPGFILHAIYFTIAEVLRHARGDIPGLTRSNILYHKIGVPPSEEQRRIVAKIEELFSELDAGVAALERAQAKLERYRAAVLKAAVEGRLASTLSREQFSEDKWAPLADLIIDIEQGWSPRCGRDPVTSHDAWGVIKTTAIQPLQFWDGENKTLPPHLQPRDQLEIRDGDVLVTRAGPRGRVGIACLVRATRPRLLLCDKVYRLRPIRERVTGEWLELVLNSQPLLSQLESLKTGISDSGVNLTQKRFLGLRVPVPSLKVQDSIQSSVRSVLSTQQAVERTLIEGVARASTLRQSILKLAFEGRLVPQDPNDEPASLLLERIRAPRKTEKPAAQRPRKRKSRQGSLDL